MPNTQEDRRDSHAPRVVARVRLITPELALSWLTEKNIRNRRKMPSAVDRYASEIRNGRWMLNGESIIFDWNGNLLDGQNRLWAVFETGVPVECLVVTGIDPDAFRTIDKGNKRQIAHDLHVLQEMDTNVLAAALAHLRRLERGDFWSTTAVDRFVSSTEAIETLERYPEIRDSIPWGRECKDLLPMSLGTFFHFVFSREDAPTANQFFEDLGSGAGLTPTEPVYHLRERLFKDRLSSASKLGVRPKMALVVKAWNKTMAGERCRILRYRSAEAWPDIKLVA
jgi:hypothetical protein